MKKLLISLITVLICTITFAHNVNTSCWRDGRYTLLVSSVHSGLSVKVTVGSWDTTIAITGTSFKFSVPQSKLNTPVHVFFVFSDGYKTNLFTNSVTCFSLPLKYKIFNVIYLGHRTVKVSFILYDVSNVKQINILLKESLNTEYRVIGYVLPDNIKEEQAYSIKLKY